MRLSFTVTPSPTLALDARAKVVCPVCTVDASRPVMIEVKREWEAHQNTRRHRRLARKLANQTASVVEDDVHDDQNGFPDSTASFIP